MNSSVFSPWPCFTQEEADAVSSVLLSNRVNYWTGQQGREFECEFAGFAGTEYAVALDVALKALEVGPGDALGRRRAPFRRRYPHRVRPIAGVQ